VEICGAAFHPTATPKQANGPRDKEEERMRNQWAMVKFHEMGRPDP
jgi:hypothetical protein